jgi:hypothetical protein
MKEALLFAFLFITISLVLRFIIRDAVESGVKKAMGYTNHQLDIITEELRSIGKK